MGISSLSNITTTTTTMFKIICAAALLAIAAADTAPRYVPAAAPAYPDVPAVYAYNYALADDYSGSKFQAGENRDGYATSGSYSVNLPDGRIQTVTYAASGYVADVSYSGEAKYPEAKAYKPAAYSA